MAVFAASRSRCGHIFSISYLQIIIQALFKINHFSTFPAVVTAHVYVPGNGFCRGFTLKYGKFPLPLCYLTALSVPKVPTYGNRLYFLLILSVHAGSPILRFLNEIRFLWNFPDFLSFPQPNLHFSHFAPIPTPAPHTQSYLSSGSTRSAPEAARYLLNKGQPPKSYHIRNISVFASCGGGHVSNNCGSADFDTPTFA